MSVVHPITSPPAMKVSTSCFWTTVCLPESTPISSDFADHALLDFRHHSQFPTHLPAKSYKSNARMDRDDIFWRAVWSWFQKSCQVDHVATFTKSSPTMYEPFADHHWLTVYVPTFTLILSCIINTGWWFGTWILFSISYMGNPSHWLSYFSRCLKPPTRTHCWGDHLRTATEPLHAPRTLAIPMGSELLLEAVRAFLRRRLRRELCMELWPDFSKLQVSEV